MTNLERERLRGRREGLEAAYRVALADIPLPGRWRLWSKTGKNIAAAIHALIEEK